MKILISTLPFYYFSSPFQMSSRQTPAAATPAAPSTATQPTPAATAGVISPVETVKLVSSDGFEFVIDRRAAMISGTIRNMLSSPGHFTESANNEVVFRDIKCVLIRHNNIIQNDVKQGRHAGARLSVFALQYASR